MRIEPPLPRIVNGCPLPPAPVGANYRFQFEAAGGVSPYRRLATGALPTGLTVDANGLLSGVPRLAGISTFEIRGADALGRTFAQDCSLAVPLPPLPEIRLLALPAVIAPATSNLAAGVELSASYPLPVQGVAKLEVAANTGNAEAEANRPDPIVRFNNGQQTIRFSIPAGERRVAVPIVSSGTVASRVTFSITQLEAAGNRLSAVPPPRVFTVDRLPPVITSACYHPRPEGIDLVVTGYTTTRQLDEAELTLASGIFKQNVAGAAGEYFLNPVSVRTGGSFTLTLPVAMEGGAAPTAFRLSNSAGYSSSRALNRCQ